MYVDGVASARIESTAKLLEDTDDTILEIAGKIGYKNGSKFVRAYRDVFIKPSGSLKKDEK